MIKFLNENPTFLITLILQFLVVIAFIFFLYKKYGMTKEEEKIVRDLENEIIELETQIQLLRNRK